MTASLIRSPGRSGAFSEVQAPIAAIRAPLDGLLTRSGLSIALASSLVLILAALLLRPLIPIDETRYMTVAWEMYDTGNWLVPHLNGAPYSHKPPMLFWLIGAVWTITGSSSAFAARLAPALFVPLTIFLTFVLGRKIATRQEASIASLILAGFTAFCLYGSLVMFDAMLAAATLLALIGLVDAAGTAPRKGFALFAAGIGCGLLVKGPVIFIHVLPAALLAPLWLQRPRRWSRWYVSVLAAIGLGVGIGLLWALPAAQSGGAAYADMILWGQTAGRVVNSFDHARPFWFYIAICPLLLFP
ncbi:MAG: ArnT family glycosyltransferase, partial [Alphaproteobacteria bacterium]